MRRVTVGAGIVMVGLLVGAVTLPDAAPSAATAAPVVAPPPAALEPIAAAPEAKPIDDIEAEAEPADSLLEGAAGAVALEPARRVSPPEVLEGCPPTGRAAVADKVGQRFWLCQDGVAITDAWPMTTGSVEYALPPVGEHTVYFKSFAWSGGGFALKRFVAFYKTPRNNNIAFHDVVNQDPATVGDLDKRGSSAGCFRLRPAESIEVWSFLKIGDKVIVIS